MSAVLIARNSESLHPFRQFVQGHPLQSNVISLFMFVQTVLGMNEWDHWLTSQKMFLRTQLCNERASRAG